MAKTILDKKIDACEKFLEQYKKYYNLMPAEFENKGMLPRLTYRAKIALVLQFLEQMGEQKKVDLDDVSFDDDGYAENFFPDNCNFENLLRVGDPYYHIDSMTDTCQAVIDIANGYEDSNDTYAIEKENSENPGRDTVVECLKIDLGGKKHDDKKLEEVAEWILGDFGYEGTEVFFYEEQDDLWPYFMKNYYNEVSENGRIRCIPKSRKRDAKKIHELFCSDTFTPVTTWYVGYDVSSKTRPRSDYVIGFGMTNDGYSDCYDCTKTNFVYGIQTALLHLYLFRLDKTLDFLPKKYKGGDKKIFSNFK